MGESDNKGGREGEKGQKARGEQKPRELPVEVYFLRYAFPCAFIKQQNGKISDEEYSDLERAAIGGLVLARPRLEEIFKIAFENIKAIAEEMQKDKWDYSVVREYFTKKHNELIDAGAGMYAKAPEKIKQLSRVETGVISDKEKDILTVGYDGKIRYVLNHFIPDAKVGDKVTIHYAYAVEVV